MRSSSSGPFITALMFVPLLLVPLLAVLGLPEFASVAASPSSDEVEEEFAFDTGVGESVESMPDDPFAPADDARGADDGPQASGGFMPSHGLRGNAGDGWDDPFSPMETEGEERQPGEEPVAEGSDTSWDPPDEAIGGWALETEPSAKPRPDPLPAGEGGDFAEQAPRTASPQSPESDNSPFDAESDFSTDVSEPAEPETSLTWQSAVQRLNELGVRHFQLEPGEREQEFHFSCLFTPGDNPRVTHRFEAEATEPLQAVEKVLAQLEAWMERR